MMALLWTHASLDTFMPDADNRADVKRLVDTLVKGEERMWISLTETGEHDTVDMIRTVAGKRYHVVNPDRGDITFLVHRDINVLEHGGRLIIPAVHAKAADGGHGPRYNSYVRMALEGNEDVTAFGVHFVTRHTAHKAGGADRHDQQLRQARALGNAMRTAGRAGRLAVGSGDLNTSLPQDKAMQRVFDEAGLTTTAAETGVETPTHGNRRIDYSWTRDADHRLEVKRMKVRRGAAWHSDHDPIDVEAVVRPRP